MKKDMGMKVKFWGVRGSIPVPGSEFSKYGGNTSCVEVDCGDEILLIDAGTGIRMYGLDQMARTPDEKINVNILISHTHWDHIQGFPFLPHIYSSGNIISFYGGHSVSTLEKLIMTQMHREFHPVTIFELAADVNFNELKGTDFKIGDALISYSHLMHPGLSLGYRIEYNGKIVVYISDNEIIPDKDAAAYNWENIGHIIRNADIVIADAQYTHEEYKSKVGWGHSSIDMAVKVCEMYGVKNLYAFHHDPLHTDAFIDGMIDHGRSLIKTNMNLFGAREGTVLEL